MSDLGVRDHLAAARSQQIDWLFGLHQAGGDPSNATAARFDSELRQLDRLIGMTDEQIVEDPVWKLDYRLRFERWREDVLAEPSAETT